MERLIAHGTQHAPETVLYAGYSWSEWMGFGAAVIGFIVVMALITRERRSRAR